MCRSMPDGARWNAVTAIETAMVNEVTPGNSDGSVLDYANVKKHILKCDCGKLFEIAVKDCPGKRAVKDCGCGIGAVLGGEYKANLAVYLPLSMIKEVDDYANHFKLKRMHAFNKLIECGLSRMDTSSTWRTGSRANISLTLPESLINLATETAIIFSQSKNKTVVCAIESALKFMKETEVNTRG